jgi:surface protein
MYRMFYGATEFDQDLGSWDISSVSDMTGFFDLSGMSSTNFDSTLIGWTATKNNLEYTLGAEGLTPTIASLPARLELEDKGLTIDYGTTPQLSERPFIITVSMPPDDLAIELNLSGDFFVDWGDGNITFSQGPTVGNTYESAGNYQITIGGSFPSLSGEEFFPNAYSGFLSGYVEKLISIDKWGNQQWENLASAFSRASNLVHLNDRELPDFSEVTSMAAMFAGASAFTGTNSAADNDSMGRWILGSVTDMGSMFAGTTIFNQDISGWDVSNVTNMVNMFSGATIFDQDISGWNVSNVTNMAGMFAATSAFNQALSRWNVSQVTNMSQMFSNSVFNEEIGGWEPSNVTDMSNMFQGATQFNKNISGWAEHVSNVTTMSSMFNGASAFNQPLTGWITTNLTSMTGMFFRATAFNPETLPLDVSNVTRMSSVFSGASLFNTDIGDWDVSSATTMSNMFTDASAFNQNLGGWDISSVSNMSGLFDFSGMTNPNFDNTLIGWAATKNNLPFTLGAQGLTPTDASLAARLELEMKGLTIDYGAP